MNPQDQRKNKMCSLNTSSNKNNFLEKITISWRKHWTIFPGLNRLNQGKSLQNYWMFSDTIPTKRQNVAITSIDKTSHIHSVRAVSSSRMIQDSKQAKEEPNA